MMVMEFIIELFFTASLSLCLAFLFAKLVSLDPLIDDDDDDEEPEIESVSEESNHHDVLIMYKDEICIQEACAGNTVLEKVLAPDDQDTCETTSEEQEIKLDNEESLLLDDDDDDDWEGVEKTEVDKLFDSASKFVASSHNNEVLCKLPNDVHMQFYGFNKVAMEGPCRHPPPMPLMLSARAKWNSWRRLGNMTPEVAMEKYVNLLSVSIPGWMAGNPEGVNGHDKHNGALEVEEFRTEGHESLSIQHPPDPITERKLEGLQSLGESSDAKSL